VTFGLFSACSQSEQEAKPISFAAIRRTGALIVILFASVALADKSNASPTKHLPSQQQVLTFIADTIDWYRRMPTAQRIGNEPADWLFLEDNRQINNEIVRLSLQFGKAVAAIDRAGDPARPHAEPESPGANGELQYLIAAKAELDAKGQQSADQLRAATLERLSARGAERTNLDNQIGDIRSRLQVLQAMSGSYKRLLDFVRTASADPGRATSLASLVENLEHTVPEVFVAAAPSQASKVLAQPTRAMYRIMGMISRLSDLARKQRITDDAIRRTDALAQSLQSVRRPLTAPFQVQFSSFSLDTMSLDRLQKQQSRLTDLVAEAQTISPAIAALIKEETLLNLYRSHLVEWRSETQMEYRAAWKALLVGLGVLGAVIAFLLVISAMVRKAAHRHVRDFDTRQMVLIGERFLFWLAVIALVLFAFAFDLGSLATFLGLVSAGLAVGLHDVFAAIGGHLLIARKFHVRLGDRIEISGVTGEVTNLGLMQFELSEINANTGERTGRVVFFANSYVFVSPATPLFRQLKAPRER